MLSCKIVKPQNIQPRSRRSYVQTKAPTQCNYERSSIPSFTWSLQITKAWIAKKLHVPILHLSSAGRSNIELVAGIILLVFEMGWRVLCRIMWENKISKQVKMNLQCLKWKKDIVGCVPKYDSLLIAIHQPWGTQDGYFYFNSHWTSTQIWNWAFLQTRGL